VAWESNYWIADVNKQALQKVSDRLRVGGEGDKTYRMEFRRGSVWQPVAEAPKQVSYRAPFAVNPNTATQAISQALAGYIPEWERTTPYYYEYQVQRNKNSPGMFEQLYGFNQQPAQLTGEQRAYMPVWEQASWMPEQDRQAFIQQRAQALQQALKNANPAVADTETANLNLLSQFAASRRQAFTDTLTQLAKKVLLSEILQRLMTSASL